MVFKQRALKESHRMGSGRLPLWRSLGDGDN